VDLSLWTCHHLHHLDQDPQNEERTPESAELWKTILEEHKLSHSLQRDVK